MPLLLTRREPGLRERMEDPRADPVLLARTYSQLARINALFAQWRRTWSRYLRPRLTDPDRVYTLLDVGFGGGDIPAALVGWARQDGRRLQVTAIDRDPRALEYARALPPDPDLTFELASTRDLVAAGRRFDFVISNHVLHHLRPEELQALLADAEELTRGLVLFSDIERSPVALLSFALSTWPFFRRSFTVHDGLVSIRRSYTAAELRRAVPQGWQVARMFPYRLLLLREP